MQAHPSPDHVLLTALGLNARETVYSLDDETPATARLAPLALLKTLHSHGDVPRRVMAVATQDAKNNTWPHFQDEVRRLTGIEAECLDVPRGKTGEEIQRIIETAAAAVPADAHVTLDITHGFRHFPFIMYALALYLQSLRNVTIRGVYYGMQEAQPATAPKPIVDLQPLMELPQWFYAVRVFQDLGNAKPIAELMRPLVQQFHDLAVSQEHDVELHKQEKASRDLAKLFEQVTFDYGAALPLELGRSAQMLCVSVEERLSSILSQSLPLTSELGAMIGQAARPFEFSSAPAKKGKWKSQIALGESELQRQAAMIDSYLATAQLPLALGLMREWVISWAMFACGVQQGWLGYAARKPFERRLGALAALLEKNNRPADFEPSETHKAFGNFWKQLSDELRNALHHHGMREDVVEAAPPGLPEVKAFWETLKRGRVELPNLGGGLGRSLISAQGTRPGVLFSALHAAAPVNRCLVVCSPQSEPSVAEAASRAGYDGAIETLVVQDVHGGYDEINKLANQMRAWLLEADEVVANLTGGTTMMGVLVQHLVEAAVRLDRPTRRFALVDRRPPEQQDAEPYVVGECHWLDPKEANHANA